MSHSIVIKKRTIIFVMMMYRVGIAPSYTCIIKRNYVIEEHSTVLTIEA
jgi:hypothetical protein